MLFNCLTAKVSLRMSVQHQGKTDFIVLMYTTEKIAGDNLFDMESRIRQSMYKRMEEGNADLNLTLKILQQRLGSLEQDVARSNVAFIHLRGEWRGNLQ